MTVGAPHVVVRDLSVAYRSTGGWLEAVSDVSLEVVKGEVFGLVGESGCGKSTLALQLLGYRHPRAKVLKGEIQLSGQNLLTLGPDALNSLRGRQVSFVPQNPTTALNPARRVGDLVTEVLLNHGGAESAAAAKEHAIELFTQVGLPQPEAMVHRYPHQLSGGQQQRVCIAIALACKPELVVLDEPTTGLDVTTQEQIISLLAQLKQQIGMSMLYVTHDLAVLAQIADRVGVMYAGRLIETAPTSVLFAEPRHPYTRGLIASVPQLHPVDSPATGRPLRGLLRRAELPEGCPFQVRCDYAEPSCATTAQRLETVAEDHQVACQRWRHIETQAANDVEGTKARSDSATHETILAIEDVTLGYDRGRSHWISFLKRPSSAVVHNASFQIKQGETFALVGESGSGKSTIARAISGLLTPEGGRILFQGQPMPDRVEDRPQELRRLIQYVFQNPDASLNPRMRVGRILARPLELSLDADAAEIEGRIKAALDDVRLDRSYMARFPDELSGGERQRVAIARALVVDPALLLCDEILSALDVSVQANVLDLLRRLRTERQVSMLFISHDLAVVRTIADHIGVMYHGHILEIGSNDEIFAPPFHPYTHMLLKAVPSLRTKLRPIMERLPFLSATGNAEGCAFAGRCPWRVGTICDKESPPWRKAGQGLRLRCHHDVDELMQRADWTAQETAAG